MKQLLRYIFQVIRYRNVQFGINTIISQNCELSGTAKLESRAKLLSSVAGKNYYQGKSSICSNLNAGSNCSIGKGSIVVNSKVGNFVSIGSNVVVQQCEIDNHTYLAQDVLAYHAKIGKFCSVGPRVILGHGDHPVTRISTSPEFYSLGSSTGYSFAQSNTFEEFAPIQIGHDVWVGANVYIKHGITIGNGAIIAAGAVVIKDVLPYSICGGVPAKLIKMRFTPEITEELQRIEWWNWDDAKMNSQHELFQKEELLLEDLENFR